MKKQHDFINDDHTWRDVCPPWKNIFPIKFKHGIYIHSCVLQTCDFKITSSEPDRHWYSFPSHHLRADILTCLISSTLFLCIWKAGLTQRPQEHCSPYQLKEPSLELHFGHKSWNRHGHKRQGIHLSLSSFTLLVIIYGNTVNMSQMSVAVTQQCLYPIWRLQITVQGRTDWTSVFKALTLRHWVA